MLLDMSDVLTEWQQSVALKTVTTTTADFEETTVVEAETISAVVQPADKTKLQVDSLDWNKEYVLIHKKTGGVDIGQYIEWDNRDFKIIGPNGNYKNYGFVELVGEETKKPLLAVTV